MSNKLSLNEILKYTIKIIYLMPIHMYINVDVGFNEVSFTKPTDLILVSRKNPLIVPVRIYTMWMQIILGLLGLQVFLTIFH